VECVEEKVEQIVDHLEYEVEMEAENLLLVSSGLGYYPVYQ
jgi:hypothetical protein